jgi:hypothetical protein
MVEQMAVARAVAPRSSMERRPSQGSNFGPSTLEHHAHPCADIWAARVLEPSPIFGLALAENGTMFGLPRPSPLN